MSIKCTICLADTTVLLSFLKTSPFLRTYVNSNYTYEEPTPTPPPITNWGSDFSCGNFAPSTSVPTSVHKLRPGDIKVVAALGDSNTVRECLCWCVLCCRLYVCVCARLCACPCMHACKTEQS
uniref:Si:ch211-214p16.3 n=1 Tax=Hucho hucho TaxID=62062 RepID=A0A4W5N149_9TELE